MEKQKQSGGQARVLRVRRMGDDEVVREISVSGSDGHVERVISGLLRNMNTDEFYVDDGDAYVTPDD